MHNHFQISKARTFFLIGLNQNKAILWNDWKIKQYKLYQLLKVNMSGQSKCGEILSKLDIFSYIPVPHTYPISSRKSKIGSLIFICIILGYFIFDFVKLITDNTPVINLYFQNTPNNQQYAMPQVAFAYIYGPGLSMTLNDPTYLTFLFETVTGEYVNSSVVTTKKAHTIVNNCKPDWLGAYNNVYQNLSCVQNNLQIMNPPLKRLNSISQRLTISLCTPSNTTTCQSPTDIAKMMAGGRFIMVINQPQGFNFQTGEIEWSDYPFQVYQFFLVPGLYNRVGVLFYPYNYITYPDFLTFFTTDTYFYFKTLEPVSLISNVSIYNTYLTASITFAIAAELTQVEVHYQTIIEHVSMWGALASLIFTVMALCCLAYNKNKFLKKNPSWSQFDRAMRKKIQLEVQNKIIREQDESGISSIRRQVELTHDL